MAAATEMGIAQILAGKSVEFYIFEITLGDDRIVKTADLSEVCSLQKNTCPFPSEVDSGIRATKRLCCAESPDDIAVEQVRGGECSRHFESPKPP